MNERTHPIIAALEVLDEDSLVVALKIARGKDNRHRWHGKLAQNIADLEDFGQHLPIRDTLFTHQLCSFIDADAAIAEICDLRDNISDDYISDD